MKMRQLLLLLGLLGVILAFGGNLFAAVDVAVPNGDFAMYKPGTDTRVVSWGADGYNIWVQQIGMDRPLSGTASDGTPGYVIFSDGTTGTVVDIPGWLTPIESPNGAGQANRGDLFSPGFADDGTSCCNVFGDWSGQNGGLIQSDAPLVLPIANGDGIFTISCMVQGDPRPKIFQLFVDGVKVEPISQVDPEETSWQVWSRTYEALPDGDVTIIVGTPKPLDPGTAEEPGADRLFGSRLKIDNITMSAEQSVYPPNDPCGVSPIQPGQVTLTWGNWLPKEAGNPVGVTVYWGTDPREVTTPLTSGQDITSAALDCSVERMYYWKVDTDIGVAGDPCIVEGTVFAFKTEDDPAPVIDDITAGQMTWSTEPVYPVVTITNNGDAPTEIEWVADPADGVVITDGNTEAPTVTITKAAATGTADTVTLTVSVWDAANPTPKTATVQIDVYDDACHLAREGLGQDYTGDLDKNCLVNEYELGLIAEMWLNQDKQLDEPAVSVYQRTGLVINGDFETVFKAGTTIAGNVAGGSWSCGVGPGIPIDNGSYEFSDGTTGDIADIPGWVGYDVQTYLDAGGSYSRIANNPDAIAGNLQGGVAAQSPFDGQSCYVSNGGNWGNAIGGMITSETVLGTVQTCEYTLSAMINNNGVTDGVPGAVPFVLNLEVGGEIITPTTEVSPALDGTWKEYSRTYSAADLAGLIGQPVKVVVGVDRDATGTQTRFDDVTLTTDITDEDPNVIAGDDVIAFANVPIDLAGTVNTVLTGAQSYLWTAYPGDGVVFSDPVDESDPNTSASLNTTVTIPESGLTTLALTVTIDGIVRSDVMVVSVYADKCAAAKIVDPSLEFDITDFNGDCNTNLEDFLVIASEWLIDYNAPGPIDIPEDKPEE